MATPVFAVSNGIPQGGDVFIGENGLDVSSFINSGQTVSWYSGSQVPGESTPVNTYTIADSARFYVYPGSFTNYTGKWYIGTTPEEAFVVKDPSVDIRVWDQTTGKDVTGKAVMVGDFVNFEIDSNLYSISERPGFDPLRDGFMTIIVKSADGTVYRRLLQDPKVSIPLENLTDNSTPFYWVPANVSGKGWNTGLYPAGSSYSVQAVSDANGMDVNYRVPGKTVSPVHDLVIRFSSYVSPTSAPTFTFVTLAPTITSPTPQPTITAPTTVPTIIPPTPAPPITPAVWHNTKDLINSYSGSNYPGTIALPRMTFTEKDHGKTVGLERNDVVAVSLDENPSTGFIWVMTNTSGIEILKDSFITQEPVIPSQNPVAGRGGVRTWTLKMTGTGNQTFQGIYKQPWMPDSDSVATYAISFDVR